MGTRLQHALSWLPRSRRRGFTTPQLLAGLGAAFLLGLALLTLDGGGPGQFIAQATVGRQTGGGKSAAGKSGGKGRGKEAATLPTPPLYPRPASPLLEDAPLLAQRRAASAQSERWRQFRARRSLARMHGDEAAAILAQLPEPQAADLLRGLDEHALGRVLAEAPPAQAAQWLNLLTAPVEVPPLPDELASNAQAMSAEERLTELLRRYGYAADGSRLPGQAGSDGMAAGEDEQTPPGGIDAAGDELTAPPDDPAAADGGAQAGTDAGLPEDAALT